MITVTINEKEITLEKPVTVLEAARSAGISIPTLCYHETLERYGGCRLCLVEVEKMPRLQTACTLMTADGMVVRTETEAIAEVRRGILEFLLINHPLDCPYCDKAGECKLQDLVEKYGPTTGRYKEKKRRMPESLEDPIIIRNMERCIVCTRCVRMCEGVQGASAIAVMDRGGHSHIEPFSGGKYDCEYCGNCLTVCPVGAIMSRLHRHSYRPWQMTDAVETICPYCGVGCTVVAQVRDDTIKRIIPKLGSPVNNGLLCSRGRFGYEFVGNKDRLTRPLIRKNGVLEESTWEEAINLVAQKVGEIKEKYGSSAIAGIASPRCTNEDNYVFQKFMRVTVGTNNIDSTARSGYAGAQQYIENIFGQGATANIISGISKSDVVFVTGGDPTTVNPILGLQIRACSREGGAILTLGKVNGLRFFSPHVLDPALFTETVLLEGIVSELRNKKGLSGAHSSLESNIKDINVSVEQVITECKIGADDFQSFVTMLSGASNPALVIGKEIIQSSGASYKLLLLSAINYLINGRIYLLSERANEQGVLDMGSSPDLLPGSRPVEIAELRRRYEKAWQVTLPDKPGLTLFEMIHGAKEGSVRAIYVMGENPLFNLPDSGNVKEALGNLDFLVVQDIFMTETAETADVVLPSLSWAEKEGTFTNMERRIQRLRKAISREGKEDWRIVSDVSSNMGIAFSYSSAEDVFAEIRSVSPLHRDLTYDDIEEGNALWPFKGEPLRGGLEITFEKGNGDSERGTFYLKVDKPLFHSGTLTRRSSALMRICPEAVARISSATAEELSVTNGDSIRISTRIGSLSLPVFIDANYEGSSIMVSNNFEGKGAFSIMECSIDPVLKVPCLDKVIVNIEKSDRPVHNDPGNDSEVRI
jgi:NADH-quinone oxidoreductase chain G